MDVSDRRMQVQLTQEAKIASVFLYIRAIFAFVGFVSALRAPRTRGERCLSPIPRLKLSRGLKGNPSRPSALKQTPCGRQAESDFSPGIIVASFVQIPAIFNEQEGKNDFAAKIIK